MAVANEPDTGSFLRLHGGAPDSLLALSLHEQMALSVAVYEPLTIPSLAQTEEYACALSGKEVVEARLSRQDVLRRPGGPDAVLYIHEAAIRLVVGGPEVMRDQVSQIAREQREIGYTSEFKRDMSPWANFSLGFTYLSPVVGIYTLFAFALATAAAFSQARRKA